MANKKLDKYDLLVDVIKAIYNDNEDAKIETTNLNANAARRGSWLIEDTPQIPTKRGGIKTGTFSQNRLNAESVYIGETLIRRIHLEPVPLKGKFSEFALDTGHKYVLRSPKGEAEFTQNDEDFILVWGAILSKADIHSKPGSSLHLLSPLRRELTKGLKISSPSPLNIAVTKLLFFKKAALLPRNSGPPKKICT